MGRKTKEELLDEKIAVLKEEAVSAHHRWVIGTLYYQRKLKKSMGILWTKKQEWWLDYLEGIAKHEKLDVPRE